MKLSLSTLAKAPNNPQKNCITTQNVETNPFILLQHWLHNDIVLFDDSLSLFLCLSVKTSSLSDHTSKVTANNGALSKLIHAQGMDWQWRISVSRLYKATQLFPPSVHNQTSAIQCHKPINAAFVLAWHHCFGFIKISLLWHRCFFVSFPNKLHSFFSFCLNNDTLFFFSLSSCSHPDPHVSPQNGKQPQCTVQTSSETKTTRIFFFTLSQLLNNLIKSY